MPLLHSSYKCFRAAAGEEPLPIEEAFMADTQLPAFIGRFYEREDAMLDNVWQVYSGKLP